jgi:hypothetical protein
MSDQIPNPTKEPHKFFDVVGPGMTAPSASSKPIIVSGLPKRGDPMMSQEKTASIVVSPVTTTISQSVAAVTETRIADKLPHGSHHRLRKMLPLVIGLVILFIAVDLLIDANVIHTSVTPLTNFFHHH